MKTWKVWIWVGAAVAGLAVFALLLALWNNLNSEWTVETQAAQLTLDHSPIDRIESHQVFTAAGVEEVFYGTDAFGRPWYAFVHGTPPVVSYLPAAEVETDREVRAKAAQLGIRPLAVTIGYLNGTAQAAFRTQANVVWEVYGKDAEGHRVWAYFDAVSGRLIGRPLQIQPASWKHVTPATGSLP
ncbi:MAG: hypothetical protein K6T30_03710 [Alicyclobacillus sp.]|nr:hypothetical protein [Alicyclobacillus sp.]